MPVSLPVQLLLPLSLCLWRGALRPSGRFFLLCGPDALYFPFAKHMLPLCKEPARLLILSLCCAPDSILVFLRSAGDMLPLYEELARLMCLLCPWCAYVPMTCFILHFRKCRGDAAAVRGAGPPAALQRGVVRLCRVSQGPHYVASRHGLAHVHRIEHVLLA